jgi:hypothetical protein
MLEMRFIGQSEEEIEITSDSEEVDEIQEEEKLESKPNVTGKRGNPAFGKKNK